MLSRYYYPLMVRLPLTPDDIARGRRLGAALRRARGGRTVLDTALAAGVSPETLRKIESGRVATPAFSTVAAVADVLGLSLDALWADARPVVDPPAGTGSRTGDRLVS
jgi:transcriptional regulator with XRE-family HTH domain